MLSLMTKVLVINFNKRKPIVDTLIQISLLEMLWGQSKKCLLLPSPHQKPPKWFSLKYLCYRVLQQASGEETAWKVTIGEYADGLGYQDHDGDGFEDVEMWEDAREA